MFSSRTNHFARVQSPVKMEGGFPESLPPFPCAAGAAGAGVGCCWGILVKATGACGPTCAMIARWIPMGGCSMGASGGFKASGGSGSVGLIGCPSIPRRVGAGGSGSCSWYLGSSVLVVVPLLLLSTSPGPRCPSPRICSKLCEMRALSKA